MQVGLPYEVVVLRAVTAREKWTRLKRPQEVNTAHPANKNQATSPAATGQRMRLHFRCPSH